MAKLKISLLLAVLVVQANCGMERPAEPAVAAGHDYSRIRIVPRSANEMNPYENVWQAKLERFADKVGLPWFGKSYANYIDPRYLENQPIVEARPFHELNNVELEAIVARDIAKESQAKKKAIRWGIASLTGFSLSFLSWKYNWDKTSMGGGITSAAMGLNALRLYREKIRQAKYAKTAKSFIK